MLLYKQLFNFLFFLNFKKKKTEIIKNNRPKILLSGHIASDLITGEIKNTVEIKKRMLLFVSGNFNIMHL